jgi:FkbM family methyltransferase
MIKTATNIIKGAFRKRNRRQSPFRKIQWVQEKILKHQEDTTLKRVSFGAFSVHYIRPYELLHTYRDLFENELYRFISANDSPLIIDCGSNIGLSVIYYKQLFPKARIIAFEPDRGNFQVLKKNVESNSFKDVELNEAAVWITNGDITFQSNESEGSHIQENSTSGITVRSVRLNDLLEKETEIDFLKVDIEGAEWTVIKDCALNLHKVANLFLEYHGKVEDTEKLTDLLHLVDQAGFKTYIRNAADNLERPFVDRSTGTIYDVQLNLFCYK